MALRILPITPRLVERLKAAQIAMFGDPTHGGRLHEEVVQTARGPEHRWLSGAEAAPKPKAKAGPQKTPEKGKDPNDKRTFELDDLIGIHKKAQAIPRHHIYQAALQSWSHDPEARERYKEAMTEDTTNGEGPAHQRLRLWYAKGTLREAMKGLDDASFLDAVEALKALAPEVGPPPTRNRQTHPFVGTIRIHGLPKIRVETRQGEDRSGVDPDGNAWSVTMPAHYGEFHGTRGVDGDPVDVFVGPDVHAPFAYVFHMSKLGEGGYDEDKVAVGFPTRQDAERCLRDAYDRPGLLHAAPKKLTIAELAHWLAQPENKGQMLDAGGDLDWLDGLDFGLPEREAQVDDLIEPGDGPLLVEGDAPAFEWEPLGSAQGVHEPFEATESPSPVSATRGTFELPELGEAGDELARLLDAPDASTGVMPPREANDDATPATGRAVTQSSLPPLEPDTVRFSPAQADALFGDEVVRPGDAPATSSRPGLIPAPPSTPLGPPADADEISEWSGWAALAEELHLGPDGPAPSPPRSPTPKAAEPNTRPSAVLETPAPPMGHLSWHEDPAGGGGQGPLASDFPSLPARPGVPLMRPTLPALPRVRNSMPLGPVARAPVSVPGLSAGLAAALARETATVDRPAPREDAWDDDLDPWSSAEIAAGNDEQMTMGPSDSRSVRGKLGLGLDEAVEAPEGWLQVLTSDLAPIRAAIRQTVVRSGRAVHVQEFSYVETTPAGVAGRVEKLHGELVQRLRGQGLQAVRVAE